MYLTEEEARREICPHITKYQHAGYSGDSVVGMKERREPVHINCMGSACKMAWRWRSGEEYVAAGRQGYCGIAGKPVA